MIFIDSVRPQLTLLALDKNSAETYGFGENLSLTVSFSEAINATALDGASPLSTVAMRLTRTEPSFIDENRTNFAYTFSKQSTTTDAAGSTVVYLLSSASQGTVYDVDGNGGDAGNFVNFAYEGAITGEYNLTGTIRDLAGNYLDPADKNISNIGSQPSPASLTAPAPTAAIDHLAPRPLATSVRLSGISEPSSSETYELGRVFVFTLSFHEEVSLLNHGDALANLQLDLDFDVSSSDRSIGLSSIPAGDASKLYFTYTVSDGDQALENGATLSLNGLSKATGYNTLYLVDAHGNSLDPESVNFAFYDVDGNGSVVDVDGDGVYDAADGDEEFDILQPDYDLLIDGISPYWLSISSSSVDSSGNPRSTPYALSAGEAITFTLTASEDLKPSEIGMQLLLDLQPENQNLGEQQTRAVLGAFYGSSTTTDATDDNYSVITFTYSVGSDPADSLGDGIDHLAIMASSVYQSGTGFITADEAGNPILENNFSLVDNFTVFPADEYLSNNQVKFDTTPPIVESVEIDGFLNGSNLAIGGTLVSFTLHFQDDDLDTTSIYANRDDINLSILNLNTGDNNNTSTSASIPYGEVNSGSLTFEGTFAENIDWSGTFTLQIANAGILIIDNAEAANGMEDELVLGSGDDNLTLTYVVDTSPPRVANLNEVASSVVTPITAAGAGYGPGRQATFLLTFNEELSSISGSAGGEAELRFFIYDDNASLSSGTDARALRGRIARTISGTSELENITDSDGNNRSVARFYYTVSDDLNDSSDNSDNYDGGTIYLNYADTSGDPTANAGNDYFRCFDGANIVGASASGVTDCYMALDARLKDINNNLSTFTLDDSADWLYAFNRNNLASLAPVDITDFVTDPLEIIGYKIGLDPSNPDRAEGYDTTSDDNPSTVPAISQNVAQPYIGASETEQLSGGDIFFVIEPGAEDFRIGGNPSADDINLTFSVVGADGKDDEYIASYYAHSGDYLTFEFNIDAFTEDYHSNITLHSISQNAEMTYSDASSPVFVLADSSFAPSLALDTWNESAQDSSKSADQSFDTGLLLDMQKPELLSVIAYRDANASDSNVSSEAFSVPVDTSVGSDPYFGRGEQVVFRFSFSEALGSVSTISGNPQVILPLELDTGSLEIGQGTPTPDDRSDPSDDFFTFDVTYTVEEDHAGSVLNDDFVLYASVSDQNGNSISTEDLNISRQTAGFVTPLVNGGYPQFDAVNLYRRTDLTSATSEVSEPIPDLANGISDYTLIAGDDLFIAATFTYALLDDEYPDFQEADYNNSSGGIEANYSFSTQVSGDPSIMAEYSAVFSSSSSSADGKNVLLFEHPIEVNGTDSGGNTLLLETILGVNDVGHIRDIYGNPIADDVSEDLVTQARIDSTAPKLIGLRHVVAEGQSDSKVNYGPLDGNISFALTFDEVIDTSESFKTLRLDFYVHNSSTGLYSQKTVSSTNTANSFMEVPVPSAGTIYEEGQIVNMVYYLSDSDNGEINVSTVGYPMRVQGGIFDYHNNTKGNDTALELNVSNSTDGNEQFYVPVITIDKTEIAADRWSIVATSSGAQNFFPPGSSDGVVWESNATSIHPNTATPVGIGNTLSFIVEYPTEISESASVFADSDTSGSNPTSITASDNNVTLLFTNGTNSQVFAAGIAGVSTGANSSSLIFTYAISDALGLELDNLAFDEISIPADTVLRATAFNELTISGSSFRQSTNTGIDAVYPQITAIDIASSSSTYSSGARRYFGEDDQLTFRISFSEELLDSNTSDNDPNFDLSWTIFDDGENASQYFSTTSAFEDINASFQSVSSLGSVYHLVFPLDLERDTTLTQNDYQGLIQFLVADPTTLHPTSPSVIQDLAYNSLPSLTYSVASDSNASSNNNYAVDLIRPRLQYIDSAILSNQVGVKSYTEYESTGAGAAALTHYYGAIDITFYAVHDSPLSFLTGGAKPELELSAPTTSGASGAEAFTLSLNSGNYTTWPSASAVNDNALGYVLKSSDAQSALTANASGSYEGLVNFARLLGGVNYFDKSGNYPYFQLNSSASADYVYSDGNLSLQSSSGYSPSMLAADDHAYPSPAIYIDTTAPTFTIGANPPNIELTNRALIFELTLAEPLSALEYRSDFNFEGNSSYHSAPAYELTWRDASNNLVTYEGLLYDGSDGSGVFQFTLFADNGSFINGGFDRDADANYSVYLDDLADNTDHTFTMTLTDLVGNEHAQTFVVHKETDEFLGYIAGWDDSSGAEYDTEDKDNGQIKLADAADSATFQVSFITAIDENSLNPEDFELSYSSGSSDDISNLSIEAATIVENTNTTGADQQNDYLITVAGGNLPLAAGTFTLAFAAGQDISTVGGTLFDLSLIGSEHQSFAYSKSFAFDIDSLGQPNHGLAESPNVEVNYTAPSKASSQTLTGYKLYYTLDGTNPDTNSPNFSASTTTFAQSCLPILDGTSQEYRFRVVAEYTMDGVSGSYETHINRGSVHAIELNATQASYDGITAFSLPSCSSITASIDAADAGIDQDFGRGLALSPDQITAPLRNLLASGATLDDTQTGGAIRHYPRFGAEFARSTSGSTALDLALASATEFGHNLAAPAVSLNNGFDLFISGDPFFVDSFGKNSGRVDLYHKASNADSWSNTNVPLSNIEAGGGASVAVAVQSSGVVFALHGEPLYDGDASGTNVGRVLVHKFNDSGAGSWTVNSSSATLQGLASSAPASVPANDSGFGSAIAVSADGDVVAVLSSQAIYIFSLSSNGGLSLLHSITTGATLGAGTTFITNQANQGQALALQKTALDDVYLLALGLPHDSYSGSGIVYGSADSNFSTSGGDNFGGVLLLTTSTTGALSNSTEWRQLAYLRASGTQVADSFYGSDVLLVNPEQPLLLVSQPSLGYQPDDSVSVSTGSGNGQLHLYYLNSYGANAAAAEDLIFSPSNSLTGARPGYAYAFAYSNNLLAISNPKRGDGEVDLANLFTGLDYASGGAAPKVLSSHALSSGTSSVRLSFGFRFPATVDATSISIADFAPVVTPGSGIALAEGNLSVSLVTGSLDYWEVVVEVDGDAQNAGASGVIYLLFDPNAVITTSTGNAFDLTAFNSSAITDGSATSYTLDFGAPALNHISRLDPTDLYIRDDVVTFRLSFSDELNTSGWSGDLDNAIDQYFSIVATSVSDTVTFDIGDLSSSSRPDDDGIEIFNAIYNTPGTNASTTMDVQVQGIEDVIYNYADSSSNGAQYFSENSNFTFTLAIDSGIASALGDQSGNPLDTSSLVNSSFEDKYIADFKAPSITNVSTTSLSNGAIIDKDASIIYQITFSEEVQALSAGDFRLPMVESSISGFTGDFDTDNLATLLGDGVTTKTSASRSNGVGSGYAITPTGGAASVFTLSLTFLSADFDSLVTDEFHLEVLAQGIEDLSANAMAIDYADADTNYSINYNAFVLEEQNLSITDSITGSLAGDDYTSNLNIFSFLDQVSANAAISRTDLPTFEYLFTFATPVEESTVDLDDFIIKLGGNTLSSGDGAAYTIYDYDPASGTVTTSNQTFPAGDPAISFSSGGKVITLAYTLTAEMLESGFDFGGDLSIAIDPSNDIAAQTGGKLGVGSYPMAYSIKSSMPVLAEFTHIDLNDNASSDDANIGYYHTFTYDDGSSGTFYGLKLGYSFSELIYSVQGQSTTTAYSAPENAYYVTGNGDSATVLGYAATGLLAGTSSTNFSYTGTHNKFSDSGSLLQSSSSGTNFASADWYHLAHLSDDESEFLSETSRHDYSLVYDDDYITGASAYTLPIFFGGYASSGAYSSSAATQSATLLLDEHGNPARIDSDWLPLANAADEANLSLTFDTKIPELTGVVALDVVDSDGDNFVDDYNGTYGTYSDVATFAFELTFDKEVDANELAAGIDWSITNSTNNASPELYTVTGPVAGSSGGFIYTASAEVSGLYDSNGTYSFTFNNNAITDVAGNAVVSADANSFLVNSGVCNFSTCSFGQSPVLLSGFSVEPATVLVLEEDTRDLASFDVYLTFSEPVSFTADASDTSDVKAAFTLTYEDEDGITIFANNGASKDNVFAGLAPIAASATTVGAVTYYSEYNLSIDDTPGFWARSQYLSEIGKKNSAANIFFESIADALGTGIIYSDSFETASGAQVTIPTAIQSGDGSANNDSSAIEYFLLANFTVPSLVANSATPVAASGNNVQGDDSSGSVKRHVQFQLNDADATNGLGMLFLFRTTDDQFTHTDPDTAPYYGAEGGIFIDDVDNSGYGYHICPPFNKHINRAGVGAQHPNLTHTYNENIIQIHYLAIPYAKSVDDYLVDQTDIDQLTPLTVSFADALNSSEPCVRTAFYNDGEGQYGYVVDSDMEEQHMVIANAMLQDQSGDSANLAMLPKEDLQHVYFDLYAKDYTADSWRRDQRITANDLLADLSANINSDALHNTDDLSFQISETYLSIFASRFVNTINARFLDSVFLDDLTHSDIPITAVTPNNSTEVQAALDAHYDTFTYDADNSPTYSTGLDTLFNPNLNNANPDALAAVNDNRLVLSIGVHPAAISVDVGSGYFQPFESNQANFLKMAPELYDLYYGGDSAAGTEPGLDYTSRHLAYVNFDLVYDLTIDPDTQAITAANLVHIVSPFTLLQHSFFSATELEARAANGETYSAVAVSIADNVFRHNFNINDQVQHFLPYGVYCYQPTIDTSSSCYNPDAQMLLPDPTDAGNYARTEPSQHNLHRGVLYLSDSETYTISGTTRDSANDTDLLSRFMRINHHVTDNHTDLNNNFGVESYIGSRAHTSMLYNSFDRAYGLDYSFSSSTESFANGETAPDGLYTTDALEQAFWAVSPYSESPDARADQILPNAFFLGNQDRDFMFNFIVKPYQYTGFTQQVQSALADPEYLINKNINMRFLGLYIGSYSERYNAENTPGGLNYLPVFAIPSADISATDASSYEYITGSAVDIYSTYGNNENALILGANYLYRYPFYISHIIHDSPQNFANHILLYQSHDQAEYLEQSISVNRDFLVLPNNYVPYFAGRTPGFLADKYSGGYSTYFLSESTLYNMGMGAYDQSNNTFFYDFLHGGFYNYQKPHVYNQLAGRTSDQVLGTVNSSVPYDLGKSTLPHHEDDIDFDRGQISSHKLGFQLDNTQIFDYDDKIHSTNYYAYHASTVFFPSNPALVTGRTQASDTIAIPYDGGSQYHGIGEVGNYYPAVQSQESLYTEFASNNTASASTVTFASYPTILETISVPNQFHISNLSSERAYDADGRYLAFSNYYHSTTYNTYLYYNSNSGHFTRTIPLNKIFPEGYSYQLGFINREELFMYSPEWIASGSSGSPEINRFYASSVGNFGYATQFSRLNRRAMKKYHMATSSQFLGDHLARFSSAPTAGVHTPSDLDSVFDHTPRGQGATATAYGSYAAGYYDVDTSGDRPSESSVPHSSSFQSRWVTGTLRGYVLELRTSPLTDDNYAGRTATSGLSHSTSNNQILGTNMEDFIDTYKGAHPDP